MQITLKQLNTHTNGKPLYPLYFIHGDDPCLIRDACDWIRNLAKAHGFLQRKIVHVEEQTAWEIACNAIQNESFLAEKQCVELRNPKAKFDSKIKDFFSHYLPHPSDHTVLIIISDKLDKAQQKTKWFNLFDQYGLIITIWPLRKEEYIAWLNKQCVKAELTIEADGLQYLAHYTEGNLLAAEQIIKLLALLYPKTKISCEQIKTLVINQTQFTVFDLGQALAAHNGKRAFFILKTLKETKTEPVLILWAVTKTVRDAIIKTTNPLLRKDLYNLLLKAEHIDHVIKGLAPGDAWLLFEELIMTMYAEKSKQ